MGDAWYLVKASLTCVTTNKVWTFWVDRWLYASGEAQTFTGAVTRAGEEVRPQDAPRAPAAAAPHSHSGPGCARFTLQMHLRPPGWGARCVPGASAPPALRQRSAIAPTTCRAAGRTA